MSDLNVNNDYTKMNNLSPFKLCVLQNFPFIEADFDAVTNYQLLCKVVEYLNNVIDNNNKQNINITQLEQNFITLYNYVKNYFDNLDVQEEINKKLDEMVLNGTLQELLKKIVNEVYDDAGIGRLASTGRFETNLNSYISYVNTKYSADNATRFYLIPKDKVISGVGGCLKIFADNYNNNQDYRDFGIYFAADQNGDRGYYGNGVNWLNVKVLDSGVYNGKHPDLGFSFQDGKVVAGRITCFNNTRAVWTIGSLPPKMGIQSVGLECQENVGIFANKRLKFANNTDTYEKTNDLYFDTNNKIMRFSTWTGVDILVQGIKKFEVTDKNTNINNALIISDRYNISNKEAIDVTGRGRIVINNSNISSINGVDGQILYIICPSTSTIKNNNTIKLYSGGDFVMGANDTLTLLNVNNVWYELCRSVNH